LGVNQNRPVKTILNPSYPMNAAQISEVIEMALSDHVSFAQIKTVHGLGPDQVKALMRQHLAPGSYRAWRRRVRRFSDQRATYK
jgi:uncharacterized protein (TIGR03643 family)